jgi:mannose-6-phosphate isomerase-like protein (cupin superfamily)
VKESIRKFDPDAELFISEGCHVTELSNSPDDPEVSIARARVETGTTTRWHRLEGTAERYVILSGRGLVEIGNSAPREVGAGDVVLIPSACRQRIANIGSEDLIFLAICTPRFSMDVYEDIEDE